MQRNKGWQRNATCRHRSICAAMLCPSTYDEAVYVNDVVETNMLHQRHHGT